MMGMAMTEMLFQLDGCIGEFPEAELLKNSYEKDICKLTCKALVFLSLKLAM